MLDYFSNIFKSQPGGNEATKLFKVVGQRLNEEMFWTLNAGFTDEEVKVSLFQMDALTAPSPDRLPPLFYQQFWNVISSNVSRAVLTFIKFRKMLKKINYTYVSLIPKQANPNEMSHLRLFSLCNVVYKIASKVLTNRLSSPRLFPTIKAFLFLDA